ncbi:tetratricopeptide repeat protein [Planifilum fimeticola]
MDPLEIREIGEVIRKVRKERGMRLEDLADEHISPATISNIERGVPHVSKDKVNYVLEKLGLSLDRLPEMMTGEQKKLEDIRLQLAAVESLIDAQETKLAAEKLESLQLEDDHPFAPHFHRLRGKYLIYERKWNRAEKALSNAIRLCEGNSQAERMNVESDAYNLLSLSCYYQNDMAKAVHYTDQGLEAFNPEGERKHVKYVLLRNKGIYLERMGRVVPALRIVDKVWPELGNIDQTETVLSFYWLRSELLRRGGVLDEAMKYAQEGIEFARKNWVWISLFDLWTVLGTIYMDRKDYENAKACFDVVLSLQDKFPEKELFITTYTRIGIMYMNLKEWDQAKPFLDEAIKKGEYMNDVPRLTMALTAMGDYYRLQGNSREALSYYQRVEKLANRHNLKEMEYEAWFRLSQCWKDIDQEEFRRCTEKMFIVQEELDRQKGGVSREMV